MESFQRSALSRIGNLNNDLAEPVNALLHLHDLANLTLIFRRNEEILKHVSTNKGALVKISHCVPIRAATTIVAPPFDEMPSEAGQDRRKTLRSGLCPRLYRYGAAPRRGFIQKLPDDSGAGICHER